MPMRINGGNEFGAMFTRGKESSSETNPFANVKPRLNEGSRGSLSPQSEASGSSPDDSHETEASQPARLSQDTYIERDYKKAEEKIRNLDCGVEPDFTKHQSLEQAETEGLSKANKSTGAVMDLLG